MLWDLSLSDRDLLVPIAPALVGVRDREQRSFGEWTSDELQSHRQPARIKAAWHRQCRDAEIIYPACKARDFAEQLGHVGTAFRPGRVARRERHRDRRHEIRIGVGERLADETLEP